MKTKYALAFFVSIYLSCTTLLSAEQKTQSKPKTYKVTKKKKTVKEDIDILKILDLSGSLRTTYWTKRKAYTTDSGFINVGVFITSKPKEEILWGKTYFDFYVQADDIKDKETLFFEAREAYWESEFFNINAKIGRQIVVWGRNDKINPTDYLSQKDYSIAMVSSEDTRVGLFTALFSLDLEPFIFTMAIQPENRAPNYPLRAVENFDLANEAADFKEYINLAYKMDYFGDGYEASISFYTGYDKQADINVDTTKMQISLIPRIVQVFGLDAATVLFDWNLRSEIAYVKTENTDGLDPLTKNPFFYGVIGVDKNIGESSNIGVQLLAKKIDNYHPSSFYTLAKINEQLKALSGQVEETATGIATNLNIKFFQDTLLLDTSVLFWTPTNDSFVRLLAQYNITDNLNVSAGAEQYSGASNTTFGNIKDLSTVYSQLKYSF